MLGVSAICCNVYPSFLIATKIFFTSGFNFFLCHLKNCQQSTTDNADDSVTFGNYVIRNVGKFQNA